MSWGLDTAVSLSAIPLFPLPNVVLFPRAILPLHIFEERYKTMTADALRGERLVAMALLRPGWEKSYYACPTIEPVVCVGRILSSERLADGKYNFLLQGQTRALIHHEIAHQPYRVAQLQPLPQTRVLEIDLDLQRRQLLDGFSDGPLARTPLGQQFRQLLLSPMSTPDIADLIAFNFLEDVNLKQSLLADGDVQRRVVRIVAALESMHTSLKWALAHTPREPSLN